MAPRTPRRPRRGSPRAAPAARVATPSSRLLHRAELTGRAGCKFALQGIVAAGSYRAGRWSDVLTQGRSHALLPGFAFAVYPLFARRARVPAPARPRPDQSARRARRANRAGCAARDACRRRRQVPRHPLRRPAGRRAALAAPPQPARALDRACARPPPPAPAARSSASSNGPRSETEDCLYLNVYRPGRRQAAATSCPVLFWIHGGGLSTARATSTTAPCCARTNGHRRRVDQLPAGRVRLPRPARADPSARPVRRLRPARPAGGAALGAAATSARSAATAHASPSPASRPAASRSARTRLAAGRAGCSSGAIDPERQLHQQRWPQPRPAGTQFAAAAGCATPPPSPACARKSPGDLLATRSSPLAHRRGGTELPRAPADARRRRPLPARPGDRRLQPRRGPHVRAGPHRPHRASSTRTSSPRSSAATPPPSSRSYPWTAPSRTRTPRPTRSARSGPTAASIGGIGGCATRAPRARWPRSRRPTRTSSTTATRPGLNHDHPGYQWGAGHAMELAYMWPSFDNGIPLAPAVHAGPAAAVGRDGALLGRVRPLRRPARARPAAGRSTRAGSSLSLRPGGQTTPISDADYGDEHKCAFWATGT